MGRRPKAAEGLRLQPIARMELPELHSPLSEMTKHLTHIPIRNMKDWVCRPTETRRYMSKRSGKITRPMNSFFLYRSAYADRIKELFSVQNYKVVSWLAGESWRKLEEKKVKEEYENLATIEKNNHIKAHPQYKFTPRPRKTRTDRKKRPFKLNLGTSRLNATLNSYTRCSTECDYEQKIRDSGSLSAGEHGSPAMIYFDPWLKWEADKPQPQLFQNFECLDLENCRLCTENPQGSRYCSSTTSAMLGPAYDNMQPFGTQDMLKDDNQLPKFYRDTSDPLVGRQVYGNSGYPIWLEIPTEDSYMAINKAQSTPDSTPYFLDPYPTEEFCLRL